MFQLDVLVLLRANEAKSWGTYSYVEVLLIVHVGHLRYTTMQSGGHGPRELHLGSPCT